MRRALGALLVGIAFAVGPAQPATAKVHLSRKEAIAWAFPDAERVGEKTHVLTAGQAEAVERRARAKLETRIVKLYTAYRDGGVTGYALIDIHTVRTLPEAFMVVITPEGTVRSLRVLAFYEPPEYQPSERWLDQFPGREIEGTRVGGAIHGIAGSTLSAHAITGGVRRALAIWQVLVGDAGKGGTDVARDANHPAGGS